MKKLALIIFLILLIDSTNGFSISNTEVNKKISETEKITQDYQSLILNLNSQGAYASKSIKLFSDMKDLIWQAKILLNENDPNNANNLIEEAKSIAPRITMDVRFSLKINKGRLALERILSLIGIARKEGYDTKNVENLFDKANSLLSEANNNYVNEDYDSIDLKIDSLLESTDNISYEIEKLSTIKSETQNSVPTIQQPTGLMIVNYSRLLPYIIGIVIIALVLVILKARRRRKELKGISKLVRIKCRLE